MKAEGRAESARHRPAGVITQKVEGRTQKAEALPGRKSGGGICLSAEISFDGKLLSGGGGTGAAEALPAWWTRLLARKSSRLAVSGAEARAMLEGGSVGELCIRVRPCIDGRLDQPALSGAEGRGVPFLAGTITWELVRMAAAADGSCLLHYRRAGG